MSYSFGAGQSCGEWSQRQDGNKDYRQTQEWDGEMRVAGSEQWSHPGELLPHSDVYPREWVHASTNEPAFDYPPRPDPAMQYHIPTIEGYTEQVHGVSDKDELPGVKMSHNPDGFYDLSTEPMRDNRWVQKKL